MQRRNRSRSSHVRNLGPPARTTIVNRNRKDDMTLERRHGSGDDTNESDCSNPHRGSSPPEICLRLRKYHQNWNLECANTLPERKIRQFFTRNEVNLTVYFGKIWNEMDRNRQLSKHGYTIVYSGNENTHTNGIGIIIENKIAKSMMGFWPISDRIIMLKVEAKTFNITVIQMYTPTRDRSDEEIEEFYE